MASYGSDTSDVSCAPSSFMSYGDPSPLAEAMSYGTSINSLAEKKGIAAHGLGTSPTESQPLLFPRRKQDPGAQGSPTRSSSLPKGTVGSPGSAQPRDPTALVQKPRPPAPPKTTKPPFRHWKLLKLVVLICASAMSLGGYYSYDSIGTVQNDMLTKLNISSVEFGLLYGVYSYPNMILPFFGGMLLDKVGIRIGSFVTLFLVALGTTMVAFAPFYGKFPLLLSGRFVFGLGAETLYVAQNTICCSWFKDNLAFAMGVMVSIGRLGSFLTFSLNTTVVSWFDDDYRAALWLAVLICLISGISGIVYIIMDIIAEKELGHAICEPMETGEEHDEGVKAVLKFPAQFWLIALVTIVYYGVVFPFQSNGPKLFVDNFHMSDTNANFLISLMPLSSMIMSPIFGLVVDRTGKQVFCVVAGLCVVGTALVLITFVTWVSPLVAIMLLGSAYTLVPAAIWPCLPLIVSDNHISTAFGLASSFVNAGLGAVYPLVGISDHFPKGVLGLYMGLTILGFALVFCWFVLDRCDGSPCNSPGSGFSCTKAAPTVPPPQREPDVEAPRIRVRSHTTGDVSKASVNTDFYALRAKSRSDPTVRERENMTRDLVRAYQYRPPRV